MTFGERVKYIRETAGHGKKLTLDAFGQQIGISGPAVSKLESGQNNASDQTIMMISKIYNVNEAWLRTGEGHPFMEMTDDEKLWDWFGEMQAEGDTAKKRFMSALSQLDPGEWAVLEKIIDKLAEKEKPEG